ncbi:MAG: choice-of-anchor tandem repeat GloVer-containing protein [Verrucomicrobiota bacterium]
MLLARRMNRIALLFSGIMLSHSIQAQTFTVAHTFISDGASPNAELLLDGSVLYGTARNGGSSDCGTVFRLNTDGTGFVVLKEFSAMSGYPGYTNGDGALPMAGLRLSGGKLYGTTRRGGNFGSGTVFELNTDGTGFTVLKHFSALIDTDSWPTNYDGAEPTAALVLCNGTLYGTASVGGSAGYGTIFKLGTNGSDFAVLKTFTGFGNPDGVWPNVGLTLSDGKLYGATYEGGLRDGGTVFRINTNGTGYTVLKYFQSSNGFTNADGERPGGTLAIDGSTLFGTTFMGGGFAVGTVFRMNTDGADYAVLKHFNQEDGWGSYSGLLISGDKLFGTTYYGGRDENDVGNGVVFRVNTNGANYTVLKNFTQHDGANSAAALTRSGTTLYGTTELGGGFNNGVVFSLDLRIPLNIRFADRYAVLNWSDPAFVLETSSEPTVGFTNIANAFSPYTNLMGPERQFFRLRAD